MEPNWIAELAARLGLPQGDFFLRLYGFLPPWLAASALFAAAAVFAYVRLRPRIEAVSGDRLASGRGVVGFVLFCAALVLLLDGPGLVHGFFRQDDFSFLQVAQASENVSAQLLLRHGTDSGHR